MPPLICVVRSPSPLRNCSSTSRPAARSRSGPDSSVIAVASAGGRPRLASAAASGWSSAASSSAIASGMTTTRIREMAMSTTYAASSDREDPPGPGRRGPDAGRHHGGVDRADPGQPALLAAGLLPLRPVPGGRLSALSVAGSGAPVSPVVLASSAAADAAVSRGSRCRSGGCQPAAGGRRRPSRGVSPVAGRRPRPGRRSAVGPRRRRGSTCPRAILGFGVRSSSGQCGLPRRSAASPRCWETGWRDRALHAAGDGPRSGARRTSTSCGAGSSALVLEAHAEAGTVPAGRVRAGARRAAADPRGGRRDRGGHRARRDRLPHRLGGQHRAARGRGVRALRHDLLRPARHRARACS